MIRTTLKLIFITIVIGWGFFYVPDNTIIFFGTAFIAFVIFHRIILVVFR